MTRARKVGVPGVGLRSPSATTASTVDASTDLLARADRQADMLEGFRVRAVAGLVGLF